MLDQVATEHERQLQAGKGVGVGEALVDDDRRRRGAAIHPRDRDVRGLRRSRQGYGEQAGAGGECSEYFVHCFLPLNGPLERIALSARRPYTHVKSGGISAGAKAPDFCLTRFLCANRHPLRSKTLCYSPRSGLIFFAAAISASPPSLSSARRLAAPRRNN